MQTVTTMGLDIAKPVFQVHGVDDANQVVIRRQLKRLQVVAFFQKLPACLVGTEACASSHYWARELQAPGHTMRSMPPAYAKPASDGRRTTWPTQKRFARRSPEPICGSYRPDA
jgi:transposase